MNKSDKTGRALSGNASSQTRQLTGITDNRPQHFQQARLLENMGHNTIQRQVVQLYTEDDPFVYGYNFNRNHLSANTGENLKTEAAGSLNTKINQTSLNNCLGNHSNFTLTGMRRGSRFNLLVSNVEAYMAQTVSGRRSAILLSSVQLQGYFQDNGDNLITHFQG